jgi:hypothetical protein
VFSISHLQEIKHNIIIERYIRSIFSYLEETYKVSYNFKIFMHYKKKALPSKAFKKNSIKLSITF